MGKVKLQGLKCERCGHTWVPRKPIERIKICPKCKSPYWDRQKEKRGGD